MEYDIVLTKQGRLFKDYRALSITKTGPSSFTLNIIKGRLYRDRKTMNAVYENYKTRSQAQARLKELVKQLQAKSYIEEPEGILFSFPKKEIYTYDKAKWHYEGEFPKELDQYQAFVLTGMFVEWVIKNDLYSQELKKDAPKAILNVKTGKCTGAQFYKDNLDGVLTSEDLSELADGFAREYFDIQTDLYSDDFDRLLGKGLPTIYHVKDTQKNFKILAKQINKRFKTWQKRNKRKSG